MADVEIERRFLCDMEAIRRTQHAVGVWQAYLMVSQAGEVRIRRVGIGEHWLTIKRRVNPGSVLVRSETDMPLTKTQFDQLSADVVGHPIEKSRHYVTIGQHVAEVDEFANELSGLIIAEVEFASLNQSARFAPPPWFGPEITEDERYLNSSLAIFGLPSR